MAPAKSSLGTMVSPFVGMPVPIGLCFECAGKNPVPRLIAAFLMIIIIIIKIIGRLDRIVKG
jgi:hypothetical protein